MTAISRREFVKKSAGDVALAALLPMAAREARANPLGLPIGSQTWPHRQRIKDGDFAGLCRDMAALGIGRHRAVLARRTPSSPASPTRSRPGRSSRTTGSGAPAPTSSWRSSGARQQQVIAWAHDIGMTQMGTASLDGHGAGRHDHHGRREAGGGRVQQDRRSRRPRPACSSSCTTRASRCPRSTAG